MGETQDPPQSAPEQAAKAVSSRRVILMLALGGPVLAVGGCALFLAYLNFGAGSSPNVLSALGAIIFVAGSLAFLTGIVWAAARGTRRIANRGK